MHFFKKGQQIRAWVDIPPSFGQCPKENVFFPLMSSPTYSFEIILASEYVVHVQYISQVVWGWMKNGDKNRTFLDICFCSHYPWVHSAIDRMEIGHFFIFHFLPRAIKSKTKRYHFLVSTAPPSPIIDISFLIINYYFLPFHSAAQSKLNQQEVQVTVQHIQVILYSNIVFSSRNCILNFANLFHRNYIIKL